MTRSTPAATCSPPTHPTPTPSRIRRQSPGSLLHRPIAMLKQVGDAERFGWERRAANGAQGHREAHRTRPEGSAYVHVRHRARRMDTPATVEPVTDPLVSAGHGVIIVDLPCANPDATLTEYADTVPAVLPDDVTDVVLVGYSFGGFTAASRVAVDLPTCRWSTSLPGSHAMAPRCSTSSPAVIRSSPARTPDRRLRRTDTRRRYRPVRPERRPVHRRGRPCRARRGADLPGTDPTSPGNRRVAREVARRPSGFQTPHLHPDDRRYPGAPGDPAGDGGLGGRRRRRDRRGPRDFREQPARLAELLVAASD